MRDSTHPTRSRSSILPSCSSTVALCALLGFTILSASAFLLSPVVTSRLSSSTPSLHALAASLYSSPSAPRCAIDAARVPLKVITLAFNLTEEHETVSHNCALITSTGRHTLEIHTDDLSQPYCRLCRCVRYRPIGCTCYHPEQRDCPLCEKLDFVKKTIRSNHEFVFLDSDLVVLRKDFFDLLGVRTHDFDFLAMYDDWGGPCKHRYTTSINSGLMFVRRVLPRKRYDDLHAIMDRRHTNDDQGVISHFIRMNYERWDTLSLRWHCRSIWKTEKNIAPHECYTAHMRGPRLREFLRSINYTLLDSAAVVAAAAEAATTRRT